jgi:hypothetical protein
MSAGCTRAEGGTTSVNEAHAVHGRTPVATEKPKPCSTGVRGSADQDRSRFRARMIAPATARVSSPGKEPRADALIMDPVARSR